jgi:hypothetical protein
MKELTALLSSAGFIIVAIIVLVLVLSRLGWNHFKGGGIEANRGTIGNGDAAGVEALRIDLEQFCEMAGALSGLLDADPKGLEAAAHQWFSELATRLATRLKEQRNHHYRVAIWLDDPQYPDHFVGIGRGMFDKGDTDMDRLERQFTIGGLAFNSPNMKYYCRDRRTDPNFKPRKSIPPTFESVFGLALGVYNDRWGVMTVDARQANGFPDDTQWLIQRFGDLASVGAATWYARVPPAVPPGGTVS